MKYLHKRLSTHSVISEIHKSHYSERERESEMFIALIFPPSYGFWIKMNPLEMNTN